MSLVEEGQELQDKGVYEWAPSLMTSRAKDRGKSNKPYTSNKPSFICSGSECDALMTWLAIHVPNYFFWIMWEFNVLLTVHHSISVHIIKPMWCTFHWIYWESGPLHVSSISCSSSVGATKIAFGILRAYNVSWLCHSCSETAAVPQLTDIRTQYTKCRFCSSPWAWASNAQNM
jgi:hypothetical protein